MKISKELLKGTTTLLILQLLKEGDKYGYEMIKELERRSEDIFTLKEGTLYPILHQLESEGVIEAYWEDTELIRKRKYYRITKKGKKFLVDKKVEWREDTKGVANILGGGNCIESSAAKFIEEVLRYIRYKKVHSSIILELEDHINCLKESYIEEGLGEEEAYQKAIFQMGEAASIGKSLNKAHKPRMEWSVVVLMLGIIGIGLIALYLAESYAMHEMFRGRFGRQMIGVALGGIALMTTYLIDYRYFEKWAPIGYVLGIGMLMYTRVVTEYVDSLQIWITIGSIDFSSIGLALLILMISYIGIVRRLGRTQMKQYFILGAIGLAPMLLIMRESFMSAVLLGICLLVVLTIHIIDSNIRSNQVRLLGVMYGVAGISGVLGLLLASRQPYRLERLRIFMNPELDPLGAGYQPMQMKFIRENASLLGGGGFEAHSINYLPEPTSDIIFTFILGSMGWLVGGLLIVMITLIIIRMFKAVTKIQEGYGKLLALSIAVLFMVQFMINIGMNLGILPLTGMYLPFVSYGGGSMIVDSALIGIFLSVYRKKDIVLLDKDFEEKNK